MAIARSRSVVCVKTQHAKKETAVTSAEYVEACRRVRTTVHRARLVDSVG